MKPFTVAVAVAVAAILLFLGGKKLMLKIKQGAILDGLSEQMRASMGVIDGVFQRYGVDGVITSGTDGVHSAQSYHYTGDALDLRLPSRINGSDDEEVRDALAAALGRNYDVVLESDHIHVEFDRVRYAARTSGLRG